MKNLRMQMAVAIGTLALSISSWAGNLEQLNSSIALLLAALNNEHSTVTMNVSKADVNETRAVGFAVKSIVAKIGPKAEGELKVDVNYDYPTTEGAKPKFSLSAELKAENGNMLKILNSIGYSQEQMNEVFQNLDDLKQFIESAKEEYGDAVTYTLEAAPTEKDEAGNLVTANVHLTMNVDPTKLPESVEVAKVQFLALSFNASLDMRKGISLSGKVEMNPAANSFSSDQRGLKEAIEGLLNQDSDAVQDLVMITTMIDGFMNNAVGLSEE